MNRFFCRSIDVKDSELFIGDKEQLHHLKVLRIGPGEEVTACDEQGNAYLCRVEELTPTAARFTILSKQVEVRGGRPLITIAVAIPKKSKIDDIVDKLTQIGADRVIPMITERVIVRPDAKDSAARRQRWQKIAEAATLQSQRNRVPQVEPVTGFPLLIARSGEFDLKLIPSLEGERRSLAEALKDHSPQSVLVLIGPEGDFTPGEMRTAREAGFIPVSFGRNVLRVETAALYVCSILTFTYTA